MTYSTENYSKLKGYHSRLSHFSEIKVKLAGKKEFVIHFIQKCLKMCGFEQNMVLNEPFTGSARKPLGFSGLL